MTNIIPFESMAVTNYDPSLFDMNAAAEEFASVKFPVISIKSNRFHVKRDGAKTLITRPKTKPTDPDEPASFIDMVVLNLQKSKTFYLDGYTEGSEEKPDCTSSDGVHPNAGAKNQQCSSCALCPHNAWGSGKDDKGEATKGKACSDVMRLAIASPSSLDEVYLLNVPPASLKNFAEVSKWLSDRRVPVNGAVIRISFDSEKNGVLTFQAIGGLDAETFKAVNALKNDHLVLAITGKSGVPVPVANTPTSTTPKAQEAKVEKPSAEDAEKKAKAEAKAKKVAAAKAAAEAAAKAAEAAAKAAEDDDDDPSPAASTTTVAKSDNFDAELDKLLS